MFWKKIEYSIVLQILCQLSADSDSFNIWLSLFNIWSLLQIFFCVEFTESSG